MAQATWVGWWSVEGGCWQPWLPAMARGRQGTARPALAGGQQLLLLLLKPLASHVIVRLAAAQALGWKKMGEAAKKLEVRHSREAAYVYARHFRECGAACVDGISSFFWQASSQEGRGGRRGARHGGGAGWGKGAVCAGEWCGGGRDVLRGGHAAGPGNCLQLKQQWGWHSSLWHGLRHTGGKACHFASRGLSCVSAFGHTHMTCALWAPAP